MDGGCELCRYMQKLKCLNESLLRWIDQHVRSSRCCILSPVFRDYDRHVEALNKTFKVSPDRFSASSQAASTSGLSAASSPPAVASSADKTATITSISGMYY